MGIPVIFRMAAEKFAQFGIATLVARLLFLLGVALQHQTNDDQLPHNFQCYCHYDGARQLTASPLIFDMILLQLVQSIG